MKLKKIPATICKVLYVLLWVSAIGFGAGVENATNLFEIIRWLVLSLICFSMILPMHRLLAAQVR